MKLEDFIAETLKQTVRGVVAAQAEAAALGAVVVPSHGAGANKLATTTIEFDVAVTTVDASKKQGGSGVFVGPVAIGAQGAVDASNTTQSRVRFSVLVNLPVQGRAAGAG